MLVLQRFVCSLWCLQMMFTAGLTRTWLLRMRTTMARTPDEIEQFSQELVDAYTRLEIRNQKLQMGVEISSQQPKSDSSYGHLRAFF